MSKSYNKGEWSEFYTFLKLLSDGKLGIADSNMNRTDGEHYTIISAMKNNLEYRREVDSGKIVYDSENGKNEIIFQVFEEKSEELFSKIKSGSSTFRIPEFDNLIEKLEIKNIKENADSKGDIKLKVKDYLTGAESLLSFSIKSYVGSNPTLLNASSGTIIKYKIKDPEKKINVSTLNDSNIKMIRDKILFVKDKGLDIVYKDIPSVVFKENLQMIDFYLPKIISDIYLESYFVKGKRVSDVVESYLLKNPTENERLIKYKVKEFLVAVALGMVPLTVWDGLDEANGGYIVVKENAEVLCYHIHERNRLKDYLYNNTKFDTPSTGRTNAGRFTEINEEEKEFTLTLQIRF